VKPNPSAPAKISDEVIDSLRARLPEYLVVLGLELRRNGTRLVGRCPVHEDRSPSFAIFGSKHETCGCHPCGFTGDVFATSQWLGRSSSFPDAVREVAAVLGVYLPESTAGNATRQATAPNRPTKQPAPPFVLSASDQAKVYAARLEWSNAFHGEEEIVDRISESLGFDRETLRIASWGSSGLGLANGWLCYAYPNGLKWRNPDTNAKTRFIWLAGKATAPWRAEWIRPHTKTVYLTEGESDCMALISARIEDESTVCLASPGTSFPREWAPLFRGKKVILCFDRDEPGRAATIKVAGILKGHASEVLTWKGTASHV
jgi:hypothetical protein